MNRDVACPSCRRRLQVPDEADRRDLLCPGCNEPLSPECFVSATMPQTRSREDALFTDEEEEEARMRLALERKWAHEVGQEQAAERSGVRQLMICWALFSLVLFVSFLSSSKGVCLDLCSSIVCGFVLAIGSVPFLRVIGVFRSRPEDF